MHKNHAATVLTISLRLSKIVMEKVTLVVIIALTVEQCLNLTYTGSILWVGKTNSVYTTQKKIHVD